jgi:hypothetical protein
VQDHVCGAAKMLELLFKVLHSGGQKSAGSASWIKHGFALIDVVEVDDFVELLDHIVDQPIGSNLGLIILRGGPIGASTPLSLHMMTLKSPTVLLRFVPVCIVGRFRTDLLLLVY